MGRVGRVGHGEMQPHLAQGINADSRLGHSSLHSHLSYLLEDPDKAG